MPGEGQWSAFDLHVDVQFGNFLGQLASPTGEVVWRFAFRRRSLGVVSLLNRRHFCIEVQNRGRRFRPIIGKSRDSGTAIQEGGHAWHRGLHLLKFSVKILHILVNEVAGVSLNINRQTIAEARGRLPASCFAASAILLGILSRFSCSTLRLQ